MKNEFAKTVLEKVNDQEYVFFFSGFLNAFNYYFDRKCKEQKRYTKDQLKQDMADYLHVSKAAVSQWCKTNNGPSNLGVVKDIAQFLNVDYTELLVCRRGENKKMDEPRYNLDFSLSERDVILQVYEMAIDYAYFEADRYKNALNNPELEEDRIFFGYCNDKLNSIYNYIDRNGVVISEDSRKKLYRIVAELSNCRCNPEMKLGRWIRLNPLYYEALYALKDYQYDEDKLQNTIQDDIFGNFEPKYQALVGNTVNEGYHKNTTVEDVYNDLKQMEFYKNLEQDDIKLVPDEEKPMLLYNLDEMYRFEFVKTIIAIFKEDFPEYFTK